MPSLVYRSYRLLCFRPSPAGTQIHLRSRIHKEVGIRQRGVCVIAPGMQGGLRTVNTSLMVLLTFAYALSRDYQILDAPGRQQAMASTSALLPISWEAFPKPGEVGAKSMETMLDRQCSVSRPSA